jgi:ribonuclease-3
MQTLFKVLKIRPNNIELYERALTHSSYANEHQTLKNERLEFLGDSVLGLLMTHHLFQKLNENEGEMSKRKAKAVSEEALVLYATHIDLKKYMRLGKGELQKGPNDAMIADAFEAMLAAIYLDLGFLEVKKVFEHIVIPYIPETHELKDYKSMLQEFIQSGDKRNISYHVLEESGPAHQKHFKVIVKLDKHISLGQGEGSTKKEAEQFAAKDALEKGNYETKETL